MAMNRWWTKVSTGAQAVTRRPVILVKLLLSAVLLLLCVAILLPSLSYESPFKLHTTVHRRPVDDPAVYSPFLSRSQCSGFDASARIFSDLSTKYTSFYPYDKPMFADPKQSAEICREKSVRLLVAVTTRPESLAKRLAVRDTYGSKQACQDRFYAAYNLTCEQLWPQIRIVFFSGRSEHNDLVNRRLQFESEMYADVVQLTKFERYDDLSVKTLSILHWVSQFCQQAQFLAKVDDDSLVNLASLLSVVDNYARSPLKHSHFIAGQVQRRPKLDRDPRSSYYTPESVLPNDPYDVPHYSFGCGYLMPTRTAQLLYQAGRCVPSISIEDLYITGLLRQSLNVSLVSQPCINCFQLSVTDTVRDFDVLNILHHVRASQMREVWKQLAEHHDSLSRRDVSGQALLIDPFDTSRCSWPSVAAQHLVSTF